MDTETAKKVGGTRQLAQQIATRSTDPNFYAALAYLPNPDPILRKMGRGQEVFDAIAYDPHVIGELRSIRGGMLSYEHRVQAGGDSPADIRALELCQMVMDRPPAPFMRWPDVIWNMAQAVFRGYSVHEVIWKRFDRVLLPVEVVDVPQRRFTFGDTGDLRLKTRMNPRGDELGSYKWLLARHMPSRDNPYGMALFSAIFWAWTFKHSGFRYFVKFCEKYGIPWAIGRYPDGTPPDKQDELAASLARMVEDAVAAIPDGGAVELLEAKAGSRPVHVTLIDTCNREMSKALTSQTLATEIQGEGSRAASQTHRERETSVNESDRSVIAYTFDQLFAWITELNVPGAKPPTFEFYEEADARQDWVEVFDSARRWLPIPSAFAYGRLQIPAPKDGEDVLPSGNKDTPSGNFSRGSCPNCGGHDFEAAANDDVGKLAGQAAGEADPLIEAMTDEVRKLAEESDSLEAFRDGLNELYKDLDDTRLGELTSLALMAGLLQGMDDAG